MYTVTLVNFKLKNTL